MVYSLRETSPNAVTQVAAKITDGSVPRLIGSLLS